MSILITGGLGFIGSHTIVNLINEDVIIVDNLSNSSLHQLSNIQASITENFTGIILRYFNPIGAHVSGKIGENINEYSTNIMPMLLKANENNNKLYIYGDDYMTHDGTPVRDFIHVDDIAKGHVKALKYINSGFHIFNLGTGRGHSIKELITAFERVSTTKLKTEITNKRKGDIAESYANIDKANRELNWKPSFTLEQMCEDSLRFYKNNL